MSHEIVALSSVTLGVSSLAGSVEFYTSVWGLREVARSGGTSYLRAAGPEPYSLALVEGSQRGMLTARFRCDSRAALDALRARLHAAGVQVEGILKDECPGGGIGFDFRDGEGRLFHASAGVETDASPVPAADRPWKLAHVVLNATDSTASAAFFTSHLGFRLSDQTGMMHFLRCNSDHHAIAFAKAGYTSLNHIAFEIPSWDGLMRGAGRVKSAGHAVHWGLGRHGPGANVFIYFLDPDGYAIEYTTEVQQIDDAVHRPGLPADWHRPGNLDQWNFSEPPSEALRRAMHGGH